MRVILDTNVLRIGTVFALIVVIGILGVSCAHVGSKSGTGTRQGASAISGQIVNVVPEWAVAVLNVGRKQGVRKGMRFAVERRDASGTNRCAYAIIKTEENIKEDKSVADLLDTFSGSVHYYRIRKGDIVTEVPAREGTDH